MLKYTTSALVCLGVTLGSSAAFANDKNSDVIIDASELTNIQFLAANVGTNGYRFDFRDRRDEVRDLINLRIEAARQEREDIKFAIREDESLTVADKRRLWGEYAAIRTRLERLYRDRVAALTFGIMDLEELEEFYAGTVSVS